METKKENINQPANDASNFISSSNNMLLGFWNFLKNIFQIRDKIDIPGTLKEIKKGLTFEGARVWILSTSIITASVGLNIGSIPVIIGAMLIAPLMSPILGIGTALGTNDWTTLKKSVKGLSEAVGISLIVSTIYFILSPINAPSSEILARTVPTLLDVVIALMGGIACIVSFSLKDKGLAGTVIPGVAVATALMPPLCTAAFGIAHFNLGYFMGAFYLFLLNAVFIALPAYLFAKWMNFPKVSQEDEVTEKKHRKYVVISLALIIVPSIFLFVGIVKDSIFRTNVDEYVNNVIVYDGSNVIDYKADYNNNTVEVFIIGSIVPEEAQELWISQLDDYGLDHIKLKVSQTKDMTGDVSDKLHGELKAEIISDLYKDNEQLLKEKNNQISNLKKELSQYSENQLPLVEIEDEIKINYNKVENFSYNQSMELNFTGKIDTIPTFIVKWKEGYKGVDEDSKKLGLWLEARLNMNSIRIVNH